MNKFLIFTSGRSGSNYLSNTLNISSSCVCYGEVLGEWNMPYRAFGRFYFSKNKGKINDYLDLFYSSKSVFYLAQVYSSISHIKSRRGINFKLMNKIKAIGIKDFLVTIERKNAYDYFLKQPDIKIIYLHRDNLLKKYISGLFMVNSIVTYTSVQHNPIELDIEKMLEKLKIYSKEVMREREFIAKLRTHSILDIDYEEYFENSDSIIKWNHIVCDFLGIDPIKTTSNQKKILPVKLKDIVLNYDQIVESIKNTEYEKFLY
jgi:Sulfotransferase family